MKQLAIGLIIIHLGVLGVAAEDIISIVLYVLTDHKAEDGKYNEYEQEYKCLKPTVHSIFYFRIIIKQAY